MCVKTSLRRLVPITANLRAWLADHKKASGKVVEFANVFNALKRLVTATRGTGKGAEVGGQGPEGRVGTAIPPHPCPSPQGEGNAPKAEVGGQRSEVGGDGRFEWRHNALRHSFCSYRLADVKSAAQVSLEAGNSPRMIFQHYRELVTEKAAKAWFGITPEAAKVVRERLQKEREAKIVAFPAKEVEVREVQNAE